MCLAVALLITGIVGLVLRWTIKDRWFVLAPFFYGLPPLVVVVALALAGGLFALLRKKRLAAVTLVGAVIGVLAWIQSDYVHAAPPDRTGEGFRVVLWNIAGPEKNDASFVPALKRADGQIVVMVESGKPDEERRRFWTLHFPDYHLSLLGGGITMLSKYTISNGTIHALGQGTRLCVYDLDTPFGLISVVAADIVSNPFVPRKPCIDWVYKLAAARPYPTIVLGDFNTPHTSALLGDFRRTYRHASEEAGSGLGTTWPALLPVLALDYLWLSKDFVPLKTTLERTICSDHAMVVADVQLGDRRGRAQEDDSSAHD